MTISKEKMGSGKDREVNACPSNIQSDGGRLLTTSDEIREMTKRGQECQRKKEINQALGYFESAWDKSKTLQESDRLVKYSYQFNYGVCLVCAGQFGKALEILQAAQNILPPSHEPDKTGGAPSAREKSSDADGCLLADLQYYIGEALSGLERYDEASHSFKLAVDSHVKASNSNQAAGVLCALAHCYHKAGHPDKEASSYMSAQQLYSESGDEGGQAIVCAELAMLYLRLGRVEDCQKMLGTARMLSLRLQHSRMQGRVESLVSSACMKGWVSF